MRTAPPSALPSFPSFKILSDSDSIDSTTASYSGMPLRKSATLFKNSIFSSFVISRLSTGPHMAGKLFDFITVETSSIVWLSTVGKTLETKLLISDSIFSTSSFVPYSFRVSMPLTLRE